MQYIEVENTNIVNRDSMYNIPSMTFALTNKCNSKCIICDYWKCKDIKYIPYDFILSCMSDLHLLNTKAITLTGGEPLLHPEWDVIASLFKENGMTIHMMTNGILLNSVMDKVEQYVDTITVSMDGATPNTYKMIRGVDSFEEVKNGIRGLAKRGKNIRIRMILQKKNYKELFLMIELAKSIGATVTFQQIDISSQYAFGSINNNILTKRLEKLRNYILSEDDIAEFDRMIIRIEKEYYKEIENGILADNVLKFKEISQYFKALLGLEPLPISKCNLPFYTTVIDYDMIMKPCFFLPEYGSVVDGKVRGLLNSTNAKYMRKQIIEKQRKECGCCVVARFKNLVQMK